jgi:hypothetical protein
MIRLLIPHTLLACTQGMNHGENLDFWLSSIFARAPSAPILLVCTKVDLVDAETKERRLDALWSFFEGKPWQERICQVKCVSSKTGEGVEEVRTLLQDTAKPYAETDGTGLLRYGDAVPLGWFRFQALAKELAERGERRISFTQAQELARECGVEDDLGCERMLQEFADLGQILWSNTAAARSLVVLDVQWYALTCCIWLRSIRTVSLCTVLAVHMVLSGAWTR